MLSVRAEPDRERGIGEVFSLDQALFRSLDRRPYELILRSARAPTAAKSSVNTISPRESSVGTTACPVTGVGVSVGVAGATVGVGVRVGVGVGGAAPVVIATQKGAPNPVAAPERVRSGAILPLAVRA